MSVDEDSIVRGSQANRGSAVGSVAVGSATRAFRIERMRELMDREGLDALAFATEDYIKFASNFDVDVASFERPALCLVPRNGEPFMVLHELSAIHWKYCSEQGQLWVRDVALYAEHPRVRQRLPLIFQWSELVTEKLRAAELHRARIGTDGALLSGVVEALPQLKVECISRQCQRLRWVKHEEEIAVMRKAAALADWVQERYRENIRPGRLVAELDMAMSALMAEEAARRMPGANLTINCWTISGPTSASPHGICPFGNLAGARIEEGHVLVNAVYPSIDGLFIENERTWFCGKPSKRQVELFEAARTATEAGCAAAIAGNPVCAIDAAAQEVIERAGFGDLICHRTGHGLGINGHDFPVDMAFNTSPVLKGMVFSVEPGIYEYGLGGFRHDDTVLAGSRPEVLTTTAKDLKSQTIL